MNSDIQQLLTAYVLGEATPDEAARIEGLLAEDTESGATLRAERDRLTATIALVQQHASADLTLSDTRRADLMAASAGDHTLTPAARVGDTAGGALGGAAGDASASGGGTVIPFHRRPVVSVAAGLFVVAGLGFAYVALRPGGLDSVFERSAMAPQGEIADDARRDERVADSRRADRVEGEPAGGLASAHGFYGKNENAAAGLEGVSETLDAAKGELARMREVGNGSEVELFDQLEALGYRVEEPESIVLDPSSNDRDLDAPESPFNSDQWNDSIGLGGGAGGGGGTVHSISATAQGDSPEAASGGTYRGAGDTVPPGSIKALRSGGPTGGFTGNPPTPGSPAQGPVSEFGVPTTTPGPSTPSPSTRAANTSVAYDTNDGHEAGRRALAGDENDGLKVQFDMSIQVGDPDDELALLAELGYVADDGPTPVVGSSDFYLGDIDVEEDAQLERRRGAFSLGYLGDYDAMRAYEREILVSKGLEPNDTGLRRLLEGLGYVGAEYAGPVDTPELLEARWRLFGRTILEARLDAVLSNCERRPGESVQDMFFRHWGTRPYTRTADDARSTFAADVDTSSYTLARKMLDNGILPTAAQIRPEEWINYFDAELDQPTDGATFAITTELTPNPFYPNQLGEQTWFLRVGLQGKVVEDFERSGLALTFVVDTSGSMGDGNRIELVRNAMRQLLTKLDSRDALAIVAFNNTAREVLPMTSATERGRIEAAIGLLGSNGGTNLEAGLVEGYRLAAEGFDSERENRVVLLSDGVGNIGATEQGALLEKVAVQREKLIYLNTIGVGLGNHNDTLLEQLADRGDGVNDYVDTELEARRAFVENFTGAFQTIARDVKIQVEFDPTLVQQYRLIGYENRAVADRAFKDDRVDGGEVGAGHSVVALYELRGVQLAASKSTPDYELGRVAVRYKRPGNDPAAENAVEIGESIAFSDATWVFDAAPIGLRKNVLVARTAEILKRSHHAVGSSLDVLAAQIQSVANATTEEDFRAFAGLFARNRAAIGALVRPPSPVEAKLDELKHVRYSRALEAETIGEVDVERLAQLDARIAELEEDVRRLVLDGVTRRTEAPRAGAGGPAGGPPTGGPSPADPPAKEGDGR
ncbi:von Willebrand factor [Planctomycetes bacterium Pla163]|uniref:von Willebrand factor n=1 Tax=Rohdeia mirabilis TaxID=2528008 RepID=A0A518D4L1_9BACT|nr:von Willebrand factor [Planctomycetes bacterium Pla163]